MIDNGLAFEVLDITPMNPLLSKCMIKVCYVQDTPNRNGSIITKDNMREMANSLPGCPIVGYFNKAKDDFEGHNELIEIDTHSGEVKFKVLTTPYGFVPLDAKVWFQFFEEDGKTREYLCTEGVLWTGQFPEAQKVLDGKGQSMEFDEGSMAHSFENFDGKFLIINEAIFSKLCILGDNVEPCFEGASIFEQKDIHFTLDKDYKDKLYNVIEQFKNYSYKLEEEMELEKELAEVNGKFELLEKEYSELKTKYEEATSKVADYEAISEKYSKLEQDFSETTEKYSKLEEEAKELRQFKSQVELKEKEDMINTFSMLEEEDKKEVRENIQKYSLEEIESKLAVICFRKKINYSKAEEEKEVVSEEVKAKAMTYSLNNQTTSSNDGPEWLKAVKQTEQEMFN